VVSGASSVRVSFADGPSVSAKVIGVDRSSDLAMLDVDVAAERLHPLRLGSSSSVDVGEPVVAIGNPFGLDRSVTAGIVSGLNRQMQAPNGFTIPNAVQTDAPINQGNSGGPLLDADGKVIGVNAQIADSGVAGNVGVGFAIPVDTVKRVVADLRGDGEVRNPWLGVSGVDIDAALAGRDGVPDRGVLVTGVVAGSPADRAGLKGGSRTAVVGGRSHCLGGDAITAVDGRAIATMAQLQAILAGRAPGQDVRMSVTGADGPTRTVAVTLGEQPGEAPGGNAVCGP